MSESHSRSAPFKALLCTGIIAIAGMFGVSNASTERVGAADLNDITISFKIDPHLTRSLYMGERWVSPQRYTSTVQAGGSAVVEARAIGQTVTGRPIAISAEWKISDQSIAEVSPDSGNAVAIITKRSGQCVLTVSAGDVTKVLTVDVVSKNGGVQVIVSQ